MSPSLLDLPPELIVHILECAHDLTDLFSLILTNRTFASLWKNHATSISPSVLSRNIDCFESAWANDIACFSANPTPTDFKQALQRHQRVLAGARCIDAMYTHFLKDWIVDIHQENIYDGPMPYEYRPRYSPTPQERQSTKRAFYYLWRIVRTSSYSLQKTKISYNERQLFGRHDIFLSPELDKLERHEILPLCEVIGWVWYYGQMKKHLIKLFKQLYRIYGPMDKARCPQPQRWYLCSQAFWNSASFCRTRQEHWKTINFNAMEPYHIGDVWNRRGSFLKEAGAADKMARLVASSNQSGGIRSFLGR